MKLGPKSRELLEILCYLGLETVEGVLSFPSLYKMNSFSSERSMSQSLRELRNRGLIDTERKSKGLWVAKLTEQGRSAIYQDVDPQALWDEPWDQKWRLLTFDLPSDARPERHALNKWLSERRFGRLQGSVCITPRDFGDWKQVATDLDFRPDSVVYMVGSLSHSASNDDYIQQAWDFATINRKYQAHLTFLEKNPPDQQDVDRFPEWFRSESAFWRDAFDDDPFLPRELWPSDFNASYLGPTSLEQRKRAFGAWRKRLDLSSDVES